MVKGELRQKPQHLLQSESQEKSPLNIQIGKAFWKITIDFNLYFMYAYTSFCFKFTYWFYRGSERETDLLFHLFINIEITNN